MITAVIQILTIPSAIGLYISSTTLELEAANITIQLQDHNISTNHLTTTANTSQHQENRVNSRKKNSNSRIINNRLIITSIAEVSFKRNRKKQGERTKETKARQSPKCACVFHLIIHYYARVPHRKPKGKRKER
jgi:hypothetical protein